MMVSGAEIRRFVLNIKNVSTPKLQSILDDLTELQVKGQLNEIDKKLLSAVQSEIDFRLQSDI